jgi:hypothetical protein
MSLTDAVIRVLSQNDHFYVFRRTEFERCPNFGKRREYRVALVLLFKKLGDAR